MTGPSYSSLEVLIMQRFLIEILSRLFDGNESAAGIGYERFFSWVVRVLQTIAAVLSILSFFD
jgi:hypothetical protein